MTEEKESIFKSITELKNSVSLISEELNKIEKKIKILFEKSNLDPIPINDLDVKNSNLKENKIKKIIVHRVDDPEEKTSSDKHFQPTKYDIKVVGLGVEKIKE